MARGSERIIHLEAEPGRRIRARRYVTVGYNTYGKPLTSDESRRSFDSFAQALVWASEATGFNHAFEIPISTPISAQLEGQRRSDHERLVVEILGRKGVSPRSVAGHHGVSTDYETTMNLIIEGVGSPDHFDRGLAWVDVLDPEHPLLKFNVMSGAWHWPAIEVAGFIDEMTVRVNHVLHDLQKGMPSIRDN